MLRKVRKTNAPGTGGRFAIVASNYNARYVDAMVRAAKAELARANAESVVVYRVPGAFEIPVVASKLADVASPPLSAIICLGVILRGATRHAEQIGQTITHGLMHVQLRFQLPVVHEVLLLENEQQARERCLDRNHNRGLEAAQTALQMAVLMRTL